MNRVEDILIERELMKTMENGKLYSIAKKEIRE